MYSVHQDATMLPVTVAGANYVIDNRPIPQVTATASRSQDGKVHVSAVNLHAEQPAPLVWQFHGFTPARASGRVLTGDSIQAHNTFDAPGRVQPGPLQGLEIAEGQLRVTLPARSVAVIEVE
jgi:alpha-N-arabinofuranosidase